MEKNLEQIVAANLTELRKSRRWTQAELAEKINYSDKSVSKWERGEGIPDLKVLLQLAELYGVTLDLLVSENGAEQRQQAKKPHGVLGYRVVVELLAVSVIFLISTAIYAFLAVSGGIYYWQAFTWAVPASFGVMVLCNLRWGYRICTVVFASILCWTFLTALYLQLLHYNIWMLFLIGIPAQAAVILVFQMKHLKKKQAPIETIEN